MFEVARNYQEVRCVIQAEMKSLDDTTQLIMDEKPIDGPSF